MVSALLTVSTARGAGSVEPGPPAGRQPADATRVPDAAEPSAPTAAAPSEPSKVIGGSSMCPRPQDVWAELGTLVPSERLAQRLAEAAGPSSPVEIFDLGVPYRVIAGGRVREYRDETRDCAHRARVAAVFVALALDPPVASSEPPATIPAPAASEVAPPAAPIRHLAHLEVGGSGDAGLGSDGHVVQAGAVLRLTLGRGTWAFLLGIAGSLPTNTSVGGLRVRQLRLPVDIGVRARLFGDATTLYGEAGLAAAWLSDQALDLYTNQSQVGVEVGAFAGVGLCLRPSARFGPFFGLRSELVPSPPGILALPRGVVGHTPILWFGALAGASIDF